MSLPTPEPLAAHGPAAEMPAHSGLARRWLQTASIEISPLEIREAETVAKILGPHTAAYIPWLPQTSTTELIKAAAKLRDAGLKPVPHIAARRLQSASQARELLMGLVAEAGTESILLIGGDLAQPAGPYDSALALLRTGMLETAGLRHIGIAGYPEGHPGIDQKTLQEHLEHKLDYLRTKQLRGFIVSQFCFDAQAMLHWLAALRAQGVREPVRLGIAGPTRLRKLLTMGLRCGIGNSLRALKGKAGALNALLSTHGPEELLAEVVQGAAAVPALDEVSLHLFAFGGAEVTARWLMLARTA